MKQTKKFWLLLILLVSTLGMALEQTQTVNAKVYSNSQLRKYVRKTLRKHHLRGSVVVVKNGHSQQISEG